MLFYFTSRIISSVAAFLYPGYASYKTLSQRPASEEELERWLMYWSVLGCIIGVEHVAEWLVSWIPFYYTMKTLFLLYLALPQTRGSSYLYINHLQPFFHTHETQIDAAIASFKSKAYQFIQERLRSLWEQASASIGQQPQADYTPVNGPTNPGAPPTLGDPASGPVQLVSSLWRSYGPTILASGAALLRPAAAPPAGGTLNTPPPSLFRAGSSNTQSVLERRRQLEAELAALPKDTPAPGAVPMPGASPLLNPSRGSSSSDLNLRERTNSGSGRFEEIEVPSDVEGYDVGDDDGAAGSSSARPPARGSWFGWGGSQNGSKGGYERVKSE
ncbi:HVA22-like protein j [Hypsizygus marmoreus]|uniref:Protein YOP1 n=1 Tax=Hypsizygus marmoreus TaxID=39966 RepID=A0A369K8R4_HYPMA|nr:HVA22-like protein j [Hypsizygus marmoreus]